MYVNDQLRSINFVGYDVQLKMGCFIGCLHCTFSCGGQIEHSSHKRKVGCLNPSWDIPKSLKQVVTAPLPNAQQ